MMQHGKFWLWLLTPLLVLGADSRNSEPAVAAPPLPAILALELRPAELTLTDVRDERRVLVLG